MWSSSAGGSNEAVTTTAANAQQNSLQVYNDLRIASLSQASSLSAVDLPANAIYRSSVIYQQVNTHFSATLTPHCDDDLFSSVWLGRLVVEHQDHNWKIVDSRLTHCTGKDGHGQALSFVTNSVISY